jgi:LacI family transcriptional regulator
MVTLADVAEACGLSVSTVSRALSDPEKVSPITRERIQRSARDLNYVPNRVARSLSIGRTGLIGLVVPDIANPYFPPIIKAVQARASRRDHSVLVADTDENVSDELERARTMRQQVDGLVVVSPRTPDDRLGELVALGPIVFINRPVPGAPSVVTENPEGIRQALEHLVSLGHRKVAYLGGPRRSWSNQRRAETLRTACEERSVELTEFGPFEPQMEAGVRAADLVAASGTTAVIAYDDLIALGLMARLAERGLRVGRDISVIGIDDSSMSEVSYPTLTSIHMPGSKAGHVAVDLLLQHFSDPDLAPSLVELETRLVIRNSTGPAAQRD